VPNEPLIHWPQPILEYLGFVASFLASGAVGFRYGVLRRLRGVAAPEERAIFGMLARPAAGLGLAGAIGVAVLFGMRLPEFAARRHVAVLELFAGPPLAVQAALMLVSILGFALAFERRGPGWPLAAAGVIAGALRAGFFAQWARLVNPVHVLAGGMWIGTLFVLLAVGLPTLLKTGLQAELRGALVADLVRAFSPLALASAGVLASCGAVTAWLHLKPFAALWTTPYGYALMAKLSMVLVVLGIGAWNWRHQRPRLGNDAGTAALRRSALLELAAAAIVLAITAVLVSLPAPRPPVR
jgi:copper transport protein